MVGIDWNSGRYKHRLDTISELVSPHGMIIFYILRYLN